MSFDNYRAVHPSLWDDDDEPQEEVTEREELKGKFAADRRRYCDLMNDVRLVIIFYLIFFNSMNYT